MTFLQCNTLKVLFLFLFISYSGKLLHAGNDVDLLALILNNLPAENAEHAAKINRAIFNLGEPAIDNICALLSSSDSAQVIKAQYALSGLTDYAGKKSNTRERKLLTEVIVKTLTADQNIATKEYLLGQLAPIGGDESVIVLGDLLTDIILCDPAIKVLCAINTQKSQNELLKALESDKTDKGKIIQALGDMQSELAVAPIEKYLDANDQQLRLICLDALSRIGNAEAFNRAMEKRCVPDEEIFYLAYAQRRIELGDRQAAGDICRRILGDEACADHLKIAALHTLVSAAGEEALTDLLQAADGPNIQLAANALHLLQNYPYASVMDSLIVRLASAQGKPKAMLVETLGKMNNKKAESAIAQLLQDKEESVRIAARQALFELDQANTISFLFSSLQDTLSSNERIALKEVLLGLPLHENQTALSQALLSAAAENKVLLLEIIAERNLCALREDLFLRLNDEHLSVRLAAIKALQGCITEEDIDPLLTVYQSRGTDAEIKALQQLLAYTMRKSSKQDHYSHRCIQLLQGNKGELSIRLLALIGSIGGERSLAYVGQQVAAKDSLVKKTAIQSLVNWPDSTALPVLLGLARMEKISTYQMLAVQGCLRQMRGAHFPVEEKLAFYKDLLPLIGRVEEKIQLVSAVAELRAPEAMLFLNDFLKESDVGFEAGLAMLTMTTPRYRRDEVLTGQEVAAVWLQSRLDSALYQQIIIQQEKQQETSRRSPEGVKSKKRELFSGNLFTGTDLSGWQVIQQSQGEISWGVQEGLLYTAGKGGTWLATINEYDNFKLSLEFRLPPGGNSGIFLRAPLSGDPAYTGMEVQLLDDYAGQYAALKSWQYTGSIYAVQAPTKRVTKKAGEWQKIEISCNGSIVQVVLNGEMIIDTDIIVHMDKVAKNPGLKRRRGHIGLQDHSSRVEFRNIWLTELE
jgi:HEAT repeat protein